MTLQIRPATLQDLGAITAIYAENVANGTATYELDAPDRGEMEQRFRRNTSRGYPYIVARDPAGAVLGYAYASAFRDRPAYSWLVEDSIYLAPEARGRGVGKALLAELIRRCTELGFRQMVAVIGGAHPASIALHFAAGFEHGGQMKATGFKHGRWLDTVIMQLALGEGAESAPSLEQYPATISR